MATFTNPQTVPHKSKNQKPYLHLPGQPIYKPQPPPHTHTPSTWIKQKGSGSNLNGERKYRSNDRMKYFSAPGTCTPVSGVSRKRISGGSPKVLIKGGSFHEFL